MMDANLNLLFKRKSAFVGTKAVTSAIKFISLCTRVENFMTLLEPFVENILYEMAIPIMIIT
jgi:uncharacterized membrane protein